MKILKIVLVVGLMKMMVMIKWIGLLDVERLLFWVLVFFMIILKRVYMDDICILMYWVLLGLGGIMLI